MPEVKETATGYDISWPDQKVHCKITRVRSHTDGRLTGDVSFTLGRNKQKEPSFSLNFSSAQTRKQLIKNMSEKYPDWQWLPIIDDLARELQSLITAGEPVLEITSDDDVSDLQYLIKPIIPLGKPTAIFGSPGAGKSQLLLLLAIAAALPWHDNDLGFEVPEHPTPILYLDYEADEDDIRRSLKKFAAGMNLGPIPIFYRRCSLPLADDLESIREHVNRIGAKAVFIDSTSLAAGGDLNRMDVATNYIRALRQLKLTSVSLAHTSKDRESKDKSIIGSMLFEAGFRSVFECRGQEDDDSLNLVLLHRKFNLGKRCLPLGYRITYNSHGCVAQHYDPRNVAEFVVRMSVNTRVLALLKQGTMTSGEIKEALDESFPAVSNALKRLETKHLVLKLDDKKWGLAVNP